MFAGQNGQLTMNLRQAATAIKARLVGGNTEFLSVSIDSRSLQAGDLYVAIKGERFDGHDFIAQAEQAGAAALLVADQQQTELPQLLVTDTRLALGALASVWRQSVDCPVVAVTGSNGKTTVKEMCAAILGQQASVLSTHGNLNNDIGVPLTLLRLIQEHGYAVIEMGANHVGEIAYSSGLAKPDVAVITNAGSAHLEGFGSRDAIAQAKGEIIASLDEHGTAVLCADDSYIDLWREMAGQRSVISFGLSTDADVRAEAIQMQVDGHGFQTCFDLIYQGRVEPVQLSLAGRHNVLNALAASAACLSLGVSLADIGSGLATVKPVSGRMQVFTGFKSARIIHDAYNANPCSFQAALETLGDLKQTLWLALGAFAELGEGSSELHAALGGNARAHGVARLFATGSECQGTVEAFGAGAVYFDQQKDLIEAIKNEINQDVVLLVKGSRSQVMERVVEALCELEAA